MVGLLGSTRVSLAHLLPRTQARPAGGLHGPTYGRDGGDVVVEYTARHLSAGLHDLSGYPLELQALQSGEFSIGWEAYADALREPNRGTLTVEVAPVTEVGPAIVALRELVP